MADLARKLCKYIEAYAKLAKSFRWTYTEPQKRIRINESPGRLTRVIELTSEGHLKRRLPRLPWMMPDLESTMHPHHNISTLGNLWKRFPRRPLKLQAMNETILLIDDSKFLRRVNELAVCKAGYKVIVAADGSEGLDTARSKAPDVIVLDMMLPKLSGQELLHSLKHDSGTSSIPVIVLSSLPQSNEQKLKADGAAFREIEVGNSGRVLNSY